MAEKKLTFAEVNDEQATALHNSNMRNLATAGRMVNESVDEMLELRSQIVAEATRTGGPRTEEVRRLYKLATGTR